MIEHSLTVPLLRKDPITNHSSLSFDSFTSLDDFIRIQDHQPPLELHYSSQLPFYQLKQPLLESPFQSPVPVHHFSSPTTTASSPSPVFSSPAFSSERSPVPAVSTDPRAIDSNLLEATAPSMSTSSSYNPSYQIHQQTPSPFPGRPYTSRFHINSPMLAQQHGIATTSNGTTTASTVGCSTTTSRHGWDSNANAPLFGAATIPNGSPRSGPGLHTSHKKKVPSGSSAQRKPGANAAVSPRAVAINGQSFSPSTAPSGVDQYANPKPLPTPVQTPVPSFLAEPFQNYDPSAQNGDTAEVERAMRQALMEQQHQAPPQAATDEEAPFHYSVAPSVSSLSRHDSPVTPKTTNDDFDEVSKAMAHDFGGPNSVAVSIGTPKLNRTISEIYQDELFNPSAITIPNRKQSANQNQSRPFRNLMAERLQAANQGHLSVRSQSPANSMSRERSPFRQGSPLAAEFRTAQLHQSGLAATMQLSHDAMDLGDQRDNRSELKTISPKDALLEHHEGPEDSDLPSLFPPNQSVDGDYGAGDALALRQGDVSRFRATSSYSPLDTYSNHYARQAAANLQQPFPFLQQTPVQPPSKPPPHPQQLSRANFPVSLSTLGSNVRNPSSTMDMTVSRGQSHLTTSSMKAEPLRRPSSDSGTYTCTYHGCTLRFETPVKLQKHKREAHRHSHTASGSINAAGRDSQGNALAMRNSQAGPHKCERINPSTGKPCNSIFSRPYDLTRHEDTIHNARKQKVRCHLCTEEKTFSRNDALTRHMRVVHPEIDWPGKQRRKGRD